MTLLKLLKLFLLFGLASDVLYPIVSDLGHVSLIVSPGEIIRGFEILLITILVLRNKIQVKKSDLILSLIFFSVAIFYLIFPENNFEFSQRFAWMIKLIFLIFLYRLFQQVITQNPDKIHDFIKYVIKISVIIIVIPIYLSKVGIIGNMSYSETSIREGYKGLMAAQNSTSLQLISIMPLSLFFYKRPYIPLLMVGAGVLLGTKGGWIASLITLVLMVYYTLRDKNIFLKVITTSFIITIVFYSISFVISVVYNNIEYFQSQFYNYDKSPLLMVITSGRFRYFQELPEFLENLNITQFLFGTPMPIFNEIDATAMFTRFGFLGFTTYVIMFYKHIKTAFFRINDNKYYQTISITVFLILFHSVFGGHVLGNGIVAFYIAMIFALNNKKEVLNLNYEQKPQIR